MMQAQITTQYVNRNDSPDKAHWKEASIKDTNGQLWAIPKAALGYFQQGQTYNIGYDQPMGNKRYPTIVMVNGQVIGGVTAPAAGFTPVGQAAAAVMPQQPQPQFQPPPQPTQPPVQTPMAAAGPPPPAMPDTLLSNVLATAIEAKAITDINELESWAYAIANAHKAYHGLLPQRPAVQPCAPQQQDGPPAGHPAGDPLPNDQIPF